MSLEILENAEVLFVVDHEALGELLEDLLVALGQGNATVAFARLDLFWARLAMHIRGEHLHLFPAILTAVEDVAQRRADNPPTLPDALEAITQLHRDHDFFMHELAAAIKIMRTEADNTIALESVQQMISTVRDRLELHNRLEEDMVYRWPAKLLEPEEQTALAAQIHGELENLPPRFSDDAA